VYEGMTFEIDEPGVQSHVMKPIFDELQDKGLYEKWLSLVKVHDQLFRDSLKDGGPTDDNALVTE